MNENTIAVLDIETTGFLRYGGLIVEIGIVELNLSDGSTTVVYDKLVKEEGFCDTHKNSWIFQNSSLKFDEVTQTEPLNISVLQEILNNYKVTAYNKKFDFDFLKTRGISIENELDCPMVLMTPICKLPHKNGNNMQSNDYKWPTVQESWKYLFPDDYYVEKHRGCDDAMHEALIVYELFNRGLLKTN